MAPQISNSENSPEMTEVFLIRKIELGEFDMM